jgi:uncharacterized protein YutE (UPF0331/DUF86 family)
MLTVSAFLFLVLSVVSTSIALTNPWLLLNENQVLYLSSTSAQVIAAVYGLTLTGFLFFLNELTREAAEDDTLVEAIDQLKSRYFIQLVVITAFVGLALALANLVISHEQSPRIEQTSALINIGQSAFAVSLAAIAVFVFDVIAPRRVERASQKLQDELDPTRGPDARGSLEEFLRNYNQIEQLLGEAGQQYLSYATASYEPRQARRISNTRLAEILLRSERIDKLLHHQLRELITLRNAIIHGAEPVVSRELVSASADVLAQLRTALAPGTAQ